MKKLIFIFFFGALYFGGYAQWSLTGNGGTDPSTNFIGTTDEKPLIFRTYNAERMRLLPDKAFLGIGVTTPQATLHLHYQVGQYSPPSLNLLQLTTNGTGSGSNDGFCIFSNKDTYDVLFKQQENAKFTLMGAASSLSFNSEGDVVLKVDSLAGPNQGVLAGTFQIKMPTFISSGLSAHALTAGSASIANTLTAKELSAQDATITGAATVKNALTAGNTTIIGTLTAQGAFNAQSALINNALTAGSASINGALTANSATFNGALSAASAKIGGLLCVKEVRVTLTGTQCWPDHVFAKDYKLPTLNEVEQFITENQHLPNVPSAAEVTENGIELGEMNAILLQKVEELTLYIIALQKQVDELKNSKP